jgi:hypothetical protein
MSKLWGEAAGLSGITGLIGATFIYLVLFVLMLNWEFCMSVSVLVVLVFVSVMVMLVSDIVMVILMSVRDLIMIFTMSYGLRMMCGVNSVLSIEVLSQGIYVYLNE